MILCCFSIYFSLDCWSSSCCCLIRRYFCSWNIFSLLAEESTKSFFCLSINILCCLLQYFSLNYWIFSSCCYLLLYHCSWKFFSLMAKESIKIFFSDSVLYGGSMASWIEENGSKMSWSLSEYSVTFLSILIWNW